MVDSTLFGISIFGGIQKNKQFIEDRIQESLYRCGIFPAEIEIIVHYLANKKYGVSVHVFRKNSIFWELSPCIERYVKDRMSSRYKTEVDWVIINRAENPHSNTDKLVMSSSEIRAILDQRINIGGNGKILRRDNLHN